MGTELLIILMIVGVLVGVMLGFPIAFTLAGLGLLFGFFGDGPVVFHLMGSRAVTLFSDVIFIAIPLFVFMGCMLERSGVANTAFAVLNQWLRKIKGGLGIASVLICVVFGASVGVVGASVVTMSLLCIPPMLNAGYDKRLATGIVAAGGTLGILLPPSIMLVVLGPIAGVGVIQLFAGTIMPGLLLGLMYGIYVAVIGHVRKGMVPEVIKNDSNYVKEFSLARGIMSFLPLVVLISVVLGAIFFGIAAPTEAAGVGALGAIIMAMLYRKCTWDALYGSAMATIRASSMVFFVILGANIFTAAFFRLGGTRVVSEALTGLGLGPVGTYAVVLLLVFSLGIFLDWVGVILIVVPVFLPILVGYGFHPLAVCLTIVILLQTSFVTPPFAYTIFYIAGVAPPGVKVSDIYRGVTPFIFIQLIVVILSLAFPNALLWLPGILV
ncbi:MAG: TRAP transporter large permease subunit [Clostridiales bacterium]|nr:TRAP transporter large permease subunit [Clostridiales bacterium]